MSKNVNSITVMIDPNKHIGEQLQKARKDKGYSVTQAMAAYNNLAPEDKRITTSVAYYNKEKRADIGLSEICLMLAAIEVKNVLVDDYGHNG